MVIDNRPKHWQSALGRCARSWQESASLPGILPNGSDWEDVGLEVLENV
jgi:hypothetical protein